MKLYTKRGDRGETDLFGAGRISKSSPRIEAVGAVDELNAFLGAAYAELDAQNGDLLNILAVSQARLFELEPTLPRRRATRRCWMRAPLNSWSAA